MLHAAQILIMHRFASLVPAARSKGACSILPFGNHSQAELEPIRGTVTRFYAANDNMQLSETCKIEHAGA